MSIKYNGGYIPAVGADGTTLVANSASATGVAWAGPSVAAGKNICINGGFDIWQRGTSFTTFVYTADRWKMNPGGTVTVSQDTDVPTGVGVRYSLKQLTSASSSYSQYQMGFEQATTIPMRNQVYTFSFYMKANATWSNTFNPQIYYSNASDTLSTIMSGTLVTATGNTAPTPTTSWVRYAVTFTVPSDAVGIGVYFAPVAVQASGAALWIAGCQWEIGSVATAFSRAGGTLQGELAACQRYYERKTTAAYGLYGLSYANTGNLYVLMPFEVQKRVTPTAMDTSAVGTFYWENGVATGNTATSVSLGGSCTADVGQLQLVKAASFTAGTPYGVFSYTAGGYVGFSAEL